MKTRNPALVSAIVLISALLITSCTTITQSGTIEQQELNLAPYTSINISTGLRAVISIGPTASTTLIADAAYIELIVVTSQNQTLTAGIRNGYTIDGPAPILEIVLPQLANLEASGGSRATLNALVSQALTIGLSGGSTATLDGSQIENLQVELDGGSSLTAAAGTSRAVNLHALLSGASSMVLDVQDRITGELSGGSTIRYGLQPDVSTVQLSGESTILPR